MGTCSDPTLALLLEAHAPISGCHEIVTSIPRLKAAESPYPPALACTQTYTHSHAPGVARVTCRSVYVIARNKTEARRRQKAAPARAIQLHARRPHQRPVLCRADRWALTGAASTARPAHRPRPELAPAPAAPRPGPAPPPAQQASNGALAVPTDASGSFCIE